MVAREGPLFVIMTVKTVLLVVSTAFGNAVSETDKSAIGLTVVVTEEVLLGKIASTVEEETTAVFVIVPAFVGLTMIVTVTVALFNMLPTLQVTTPFV